MDTQVVRRAGLVGVASLLATAALGAAPLGAQGGTDVRLSVRMGVMNPHGDISRAPILSTPTNVVTYQDFAEALAMGVGVEVRPAVSPVALRASVFRSFGAEETGVWGCADANGEPLPCPSILIEVPTDIDVTSATADLVVPIAVGRVEVRPFVGAGWVRYEYAWDPANQGSFSLAPGSASSDELALHLGLGLAVSAGGIRLDIEHAELRSRAPDRVTAPGRTARTTFGVEVPILR